jgi:hypothetical protein
MLVMAEVMQPPSGSIETQITRTKSARERRSIRPCKNKNQDNALTTKIQEVIQQGMI